jgi:hypothetical protein
VPPLPSVAVAEIVTTEGRTFSATGVTAHADAVLAEFAEVAEVVPPSDDELGDATAAPMKPPPTPATTMPAIRPHSHHRGRGSRDAARLRTGTSFAARRAAATCAAGETGYPAPRRPWRQADRKFTPFR